MKKVTAISITFAYITAHTDFSDVMSTFSLNTHLNSCVLHPLQDKIHSMTEGKGRKRKSYLDITENINCC